MKRKLLLRYLERSGCVFVREGGRHSWWRNAADGRRSAVPRHSEIDDNLVRKICNLE